MNPALLSLVLLLNPAPVDEITCARISPGMTEADVEAILRRKSHIFVIVKESRCHFWLGELGCICVEFVDARVVEASFRPDLTIRDFRE